jgi:glycosyltransferase involved in cell wall biosynthesis
MERDTSYDVTVVSSGHDVADARLHRIVAALLRCGLKVEVLGLGDETAAPEGAAVRTWPRAGGLGRLRLAIALPFRARGRVIVALDPDALLGSAATGLVRRRAVVADVHEDYRRLLSDRRWSQGPLGVLARAVTRLAERVAARARLTMVADEHVPPETARQRLVVRNLPDQSLVPLPRSLAESPRAVYVGDVRTSRGLFAMLDAIDAAPDWMLDVVGPLAPEDRSALQRRLQSDPALAARVTWHGRLPPARAWETAAGSWVGFCLLEATPAFVEALPSKLYEYVSAGIVPIVTNLPRQRDFVDSVGAGFVVEDASEAAKVLNALAEDKPRVEAARSRLIEQRQQFAGAREYDEAASRIAELSLGA